MMSVKMYVQQIGCISNENICFFIQLNLETFYFSLINKLTII